MRTSPLPNRHAADLSDFFETVQATLNRNRAKDDLSALTMWEIRLKLWEEYWELEDELKLSEASWEGYTGRTVNPIQVEHEAADLVVCALSAWLWARKQGKA